jgi:hypothetical protein
MKEQMRITAFFSNNNNNNLSWFTLASHLS